MLSIDLHLANLQRLVEGLRVRWRQRGELAGLDRAELDKLASDLGLTAGEVQHLVDLGPDASALLHRRLSVLGITRADIERVAPGLMRDLERTCSCCGEKHACRSDLDARPGDPAWRDYCPNATAIESVGKGPV